MSACVCSVLHIYITNMTMLSVPMTSISMNSSSSLTFNHMKHHFHNRNTFLSLTPVQSRRRGRKWCCTIRAKKMNNVNDVNENPFASLAKIRSSLEDKPELAIDEQLRTKMKPTRTIASSDFSFDDEDDDKEKGDEKKKKTKNSTLTTNTTHNNTNNNTTGQKRVVIIKVEKNGRRGKVVTVVTGLENPTKELVTKLKKVLGAGASLEDDTKTCVFQGTHAIALEEMIVAMGYRDVKIVK